MTNREYALKQIDRCKENIEELKELRSKFFGVDMKLYYELSSDIKGLNQDIKAWEVYL